MNANRKRVAVLISGRGSNMEALANAAQSADFPATIVGVIASRADARGLETAEGFGIATEVIEPGRGTEKRPREDVLHKHLNEIGADIVCLAGYMHVLSAGFITPWEGRLINIHPSLLPSFKGLDTHARALAAGVKLHGCSVHHVRPAVDDGPIIAQAAVPVLDDDTEATLSARVLKAEHKLYPHALRLLIEGQKGPDAVPGVLFSPRLTAE